MKKIRLATKNKVIGFGIGVSVWGISTMIFLYSALLSTAPAWYILLVLLNALAFIIGMIRYLSLVYNYRHGGQ